MPKLMYIYSFFLLVKRRRAKIRRENEKKMRRPNLILWVSHFSYLLCEKLASVVVHVPFEVLSSLALMVLVRAFT